MKFTKRILSLLLTVIMIVSMVPAMALPSSAAANGVQQKIDEMRKVYSDESSSAYKYFTSTGVKATSACTGDSCIGSSCQQNLANIPARSSADGSVSLPAGSKVGWGSHSCVAFGHYSWYYIFGLTGSLSNMSSSNATYTSFSTAPSVGDYLEISFANGGFHIAIYMGNNGSNGWYVYESNADNYGKVRYNHLYTFGTSGYTIKSVKVYHAKNYDTVYNSGRYTVSYDANGGSGAPAAQTKTKGTALTLSSTKPTRTGYDFLGWSTSSAATSATYSAGASYTNDASVTLYAVWKIKTYTITWVIDGKSETTTVNYNTLPTHAAPVKASDSDYTYSFTGWDPSVVNATANATYTAKFSKSARLPGESDWVLESQVPSGAKITDTKWVYTKTETTESTATSKSGWSQTGSRWEQTGTDSSYYASFPSGFDHSHSIYTSMMTAPYSANETTTTKRTVSNSQVGYIYYQWTQTISDLSKETTWHNRSINDSKTSTYNYFFAMKDTRDFSYNSSAVAYQYPGAASGGSKSSDLSAAATYWFFRTPYYRSTYTDYQKVFTYQKVTTGLESATAVTAGNGISDVKKYVKYIASYNITWNIDGKTTIESYTYGATPSHSTPTKSADAQYTYTFTGWSPAITTVTSNATYTAQFSSTVRNYTITWSIDGKTETSTVSYGSMPSHANPTKSADAQYTYNFTGWSPAISSVTGNKTYTAQFSGTLRNYSITWSIDGISSTETYAYGVTPTPDNPIKESDAQYAYTFTGWSPAISSVTGDKTYTAQFEATPRTYTVTWVIDGMTSTETYAYGATPSYKGATPTKADDAQYTYAFSGWTPAVTAVTGDVTYTAQFEATPIVPEETDVTVTVVGKTTNVHAGEMNLVVRMEGEVPVQGYELALDYDTDVFTFVSAEHFADYTGAKYGYTNVTGKSGYPLVVGCSLDYAAHTSGNVQLFELTFAISDTAEAGEYLFTLASPTAAEPLYDVVEGVMVDRTSKLVSGTVTLQEYELGDANKDGSISIRDISTILSVLAGDGAEDLSVMDISGDGVLNIRDISALLGILSA